MSSPRPIGVFDSGVGGLSVLRAIRQALPSEDVIYVADSGNAPYGDRPRDFIERRSIAIVEFLCDHGVKALVVACNTATGVAVRTLRSRFTFPIVAMEPAVKPAATTTRSGIVGVLATTQTLSSANFLKLVDEHGARAQVLIQPCPGLVDQVEQGELQATKTRTLLEGYVQPLLAKGADTLVLGCTHYAFLRPLIQDIAGPNVTLIDPAAPVARELKRRLESAGLLAEGERTGRETFWTSGSGEAIARIRQLWGADADVHALPNGSSSSVSAASATVPK
ncbi:MAG TPA: glutamate racemase [Vicinamibacterales bacterium]|nr:glutamate racemase [Vicinamibacterales bacterium]